jgi:hypothetical protein
MIECEIEETVLEGENGHDVPSVQAPVRDVSTKPNHSGLRTSIRRCLVLMREECLNKERNFYVADND